MTSQTGPIGPKYESGPIEPDKELKFYSGPIEPVLETAPIGPVSIDNPRKFMVYISHGKCRERAPERL